MEQLYKFLDENSYYLVLIIILIIWTGILGYSYFTKRSVQKLINKISDNE